MSTSISDTKKGPGRPKSTGSGTQVQVRLHSPLLDKLDAWISEQPEQLTRPEAVRRLLKQALEG